MNTLRQDLIPKLASEFNNASVPPPTSPACDTTRGRTPRAHRSQALKAHLDFKLFNASQ